MRLRRGWTVLLAAAVTAGAASGPSYASGAARSAMAQPESPLLTGPQLVHLANVFAGTDAAFADQGTGGGAGNMSPAATAPFGMLSWGPRTSPASVAFAAGYTYSDDKIAGFDLTRFQGGGCSVFGDVPIMPTTASITASPAALLSGATNPGLIARFDHRHESASPGRYAVTLDPGTRRAIGVDIGAASRAGAATFRFPAAVRTGSVVIDAGGSANTDTLAAVQILPGRHEVDVTTRSGRFCEQPAGYTLHVAMRFDRGFASHAVWQRRTWREGGNHAESSAVTGLGYEPGSGIPQPPNDLSATAQAGAVLRFATSHSRSVGVRVGLSYVSASGAHAALDREVAGRSVKQVQRATAGKWAQLMGRLRVAGGTTEDRRMLATTLYQSLLSPQVVSDVDGRFPALDGRVHRAHGWAAYSQMSLWDEYRTHAQLLALVAPRQARDMARSLLADERIAGFLPRWPVVGASPNVMVGDPAVPFLADLAAFGVKGFSRRAALRAAVHGAASNGVDDESPAMLPAGVDPETQGGGYYVERPGNPAYLALHYLPTELDLSTSTTGGAMLVVSPALVWGSVSTALEYATADFATSRLAAAVCDRTTSREFLGRAAWWRESFNAADGYVEPRSATGRFVPISKTGPAHGFVEGDASQYTFMIPFDVAGLGKALGGSKMLVSRLDTLFTRLNAGPESEFAFLGNEPQLDTPYEYLWAGRPDRTADVVHQALDGMYAPTPKGYPGNTDGGTMTSWWVFNAIGLYPAIPGDDVLTVGAPRFSRVVVSTPHRGIVRIDAPGASRATPYVKSASLDGRSLANAWLRYSQLDHDVTVTLRTAASPGSWAREGVPPPSYPAASRATCD
ncbi:MAG TPA: GH92 family glycosyl hydrolase [Mycobacteriales bacterium]|nr:GH92 family glycosyl hydrolase [Mycobacteriales bacterium]